MAHNPEPTVVIAYASQSRVYHKPACGVLSRTYKTRDKSRAEVEKEGYRPCLFCHKISAKRWLCPVCYSKYPTLGIAMIPKYVGRGDTLGMKCPMSGCAFEVLQKEEET